MENGQINKNTHILTYTQPHSEMCCMVDIVYHRTQPPVL